MNEITEFEQRRAVNTIWNGARDHGFRPDFKAYGPDGRAELYWNLLIGALRRHYEYPKLRRLFDAFEGEEERDVYEGLLWLGLENAVYQRELPERPVLAALRRDYAERFVAAFAGTVPDDYRLLDCLSYAHYLRVLGREAKLSRYDEKLLDELEFSPALTTDEIVERAEALFRHWFRITAEESRRERKPLSFALLRRDGRKEPRRYRKFGIGLLDRPRAGGADEGEAERAALRTRLSAAELRAFMTGKYGRPLFSEHELKEIERQLCTGSHRDCHLHFTKGEPAAWKIQNGFEALHKEREAAQIERNRRYYRDNLARGRAGIRKLAASIQNSVLLHLQPSPVRSDTGRLLGGRVWRAELFDDDRVFERSEQDNLGDLCVDILLDASTSQKDRQETVSTQGYLIAEALTRCRIPCRVMSFCSMTGFTILRIFRGYDEPERNSRIFEYVSNGCNRDGLAVRAAHYLINSAPYEHKMLIILSDVKPNDIVKMPAAGEEGFVDYEREAGVRDTAREVRRARADGIAVICVFTGEDADLPSARLVYGQDFARIQSFELLADTVGRLIRNQLRNL